MSLLQNIKTPPPTNGQIPLKIKLKISRNCLSPRPIWFHSALRPPRKKIRYKAIVRSLCFDPVPSNGRNVDGFPNGFHCVARGSWPLLHLFAGEIRTHTAHGGRGVRHVPNVVKTRFTAIAINFAVRHRIVIGVVRFDRWPTCFADIWDLPERNVPPGVLCRKAHNTKTAIVHKIGNGWKWLNINGCDSR